MGLILPDGRFYQRRLVRHLDTVGDGSGTKNVVADYSSGAQAFKLAPAAGQIFFIENLNIFLDAGAAMPAGVFGALGAALTNGFRPKIKDAGQTIADFMDGIPLKQNGQFGLFNKPGFYVDPGAGGDPFWDNVVTLADFEGTGGATTFTDQGPLGKAYTFGPVTTLSTNTTRYNATTSIRFAGGTTSNLKIGPAGDADFALGSKDFTWEVDCWHSSTADDNIFSIWDSGTNNRCLALNTDTSSTELSLSGSNNGTASQISVPNITGGPGQSQWKNICLCRDGNNLRVFNEGTVQHTEDLTSFGSFFAANTIFTLGANNNGTASEWLGHFENLRVTVGAARYTGNYTPLAGNFPIGAAGLVQGFVSNFDFTAAGQPVVLRGDLGEFLEVEVNDDFSAVPGLNFVAHGYSNVRL
jgi:hypothetical protein